MQKFRFGDFQIYKDAIVYRKRIKHLVKQHFPPEEKYWLIDQIVRAVNSIILNIAEGSDRGTDKDFALFLNRAHTSLAEVVSCLDLALEDGYIDKTIHVQYLKEAEELANQITAFRRTLLKNPTK